MTYLPESGHLVGRDNAFRAVYVAPNHEPKTEIFRTSETAEAITPRVLRMIGLFIVQLIFCVDRDRVA